jgi:CheY-like chemotaxis protein
MRTVDCIRFLPLLYSPAAARASRTLDAHLICLQNDAVIASIQSWTAESAVRTILIVDDDRAVADTFARMLKLEGFSVATAVSAEAGLELADNVQPDAIILTCGCPSPTGSSSCASSGPGPISSRSRWRSSRAITLSESVQMSCPWCVHPLLPLWLEDFRARQDPGFRVNDRFPRVPPPAGGRHSRSCGKPAAARPNTANSAAGSR